LDRVGFAGGHWFKLYGHGRLIQRCVVICLGFGRRDIADWLEQAPVVEPINPSLPLHCRANRNRRLLEPIGNVPPAEAEANYYAALETPEMAA